jgi:hypothetical protein
MLWRFLDIYLRLKLMNLIFLQVLIPAKRIKTASVRENLYNPDEKYIDVVTVDGFDFWFMGFVSYEKSFRYLLNVISEFR